MWQPSPKWLIIESISPKLDLCSHERFKCSTHHDSLQDWQIGTEKRGTWWWGVWAIELRVLVKGFRGHTLKWESLLQAIFSVWLRDSQHEGPSYPMRCSWPTVPIFSPTSLGIFARKILWSYTYRDIHLRELFTKENPDRKYKDNQSRSSWKQVSESCII